jgi:hypothetical protein
MDLQRTQTSTLEKSYLSDASARLSFSLRLSSDFSRSFDTVVYLLPFMQNERLKRPKDTI